MFLGYFLKVFCLLCTKINATVKWASCLCEKNLKIIMMMYLKVTCHAKNLNKRIKSYYSLVKEDDAFKASSFITSDQGIDMTFMMRLVFVPGSEFVSDIKDKSHRRRRKDISLNKKWREYSNNLSLSLTSSIKTRPLHSLISLTSSKHAVLCDSLCFPPGHQLEWSSVYF